MSEDKKNSYLTEGDMLRHTSKIEKNLSDKIVEVDHKHTERNNDLRVMFATMNETQKNIEKNTERTAENIEKFSDDLKEGTDNITKELKTAKRDLNDVKTRTSILEEKKGGTVVLFTTFVTGALALIGTIVKTIIESFM